MKMDAYQETLPGGKHWSFVVRRNARLKLVDIDGGANAAMQLYNPANTLERYNAPDTLKCQHTFKLTRGHCLYSDMGRVLCSVVEDTFGWHDTMCGNTTKEKVAARWGATSFQTHRDGWQQNGLDSFLVEAAKYGLKRRDIASNVNWFSKVAVDEEGTLRFDSSAARAGAAVLLRFEMDTLVLLHTCPHPLNPSSKYPRKPVLIEISAGEPAGADDVCRLSAPENARGFENNHIHHIGCCGEC